MKALTGIPGRMLDAYGALFLAQRRLVGALVLAATLCDPATGLAGLVAGTSSMATRRVLRLPALPGQADVLNAIYAGLALGAFYGIDLRVAGLAAFGGMLAVPLGAALRQILAGPAGPAGAAGVIGGRGLPLLGAPFLCTAWTLLAAAKGLALPLRWAWPAWPEWLPATLAAALSNVGALFYVAHPLAGLLVLTALLLASRALALLALGGSLLGHGLIVVTSATAAPSLVLLAAFNGALVAIFIGGVLSAPTFRTLAVAAGGVVVASGLSAGMLALSAPFGIPPLSAPFVLTVWLAHAALRPETSAWWSRFWLPLPACPEDTLVAGRVAAARGLAASSVGLLPPFHGGMEIAQGVDGEHTHSGPWRYALDFIRTDAGLSFSNDGSALTDFLSFDLPVRSPAWGTVVACRNDIVDNRPGEMNLADNWGNHVLIDIGGGLFVLLAHLRQGSLEVAPGWAVAPDTSIGRCGNSGRSAQPHLHMHVQRGAWLGAPTVPFHLSHCLVNGNGYTLDASPAEGNLIESITRDEALARACSTPPGRVWHFADRGRDWQLVAETGLLGESTLVADGGGCIKAIAGPGLLALHQRHGTPDARLDAFVLAFGLTPFATRAGHWCDAPDAAMLPLPAWQRAAVVLRQPFGANLDSRYTRSWDAARGLWRQSATHRLASAFGEIKAETVGWISESLGPVAFSLSTDGRKTVDAVLAGYGNRGDHGVPAWTAHCLNIATS